ncbi:MAG: thioredoxin domain-containing protein [Rhodovarius sp.]|nr:DsbA family protein [Rhodovarius sp.]MDW8313575.1 thioredoxin domain-containing protein [Rhodovarius sp.]
MGISRRQLVIAGGAAVAAARLPVGAASASAGDPRLAERSVGRPDAPLTVIEYFSLTCGHCAHFHLNTWPRVRRELVEPGRIRVVLADFPLDEIALRAAMIARALPADRYEPFLSTLFSTQNRWAFAQGQQLEELARLAALAGMPRETFDATLRDEALARGIMEGRLIAQQRHNIRATPSFVFGSRVVAGAISFEEFRQQVERASAA